MAVGSCILQLRDLWWKSKRVMVSIPKLEDEALGYVISQLQTNHYNAQNRQNQLLLIIPIKVETQTHHNFSSHLF